MYFTMIPLILAGIANMIFTKTKLYHMHKSPIDGGKVLADGKRMFGNHKTWIGFFSMIVFCICFQLIFGYFCNIMDMNQHCDIYIVSPNTICFNLFFGGLTGLVYMLSELPNSFIKRRLGIEDGQTAKGIKGGLFFIIDQIDSLIGVMLLVYLFSDITIGKYFFYVFLGGVTHVIINSVLYWMKVRNNV